VNETALGQVVILSDFHLSPYTEQRIMSNLVDAAVETWDALFAEPPTPVRRRPTGAKTTSPLLLQSALLNARPPVPHPDAIFIPGDFPYYDLIPLFTNLVDGGTREQGKAVLRKTVQYAHYKVRDAFPDVPIYIALGTTTRFLEDYDVEPSGDEFYHETADVFL
jgi:hypothetical protein